MRLLSHSGAEPARAGPFAAVAGALFAVALGVGAFAMCYAAGISRLFDAMAESEHLHELTMID